MQILAIIPARGGSKGIPRKNLLRVGGKPLVAHSITQAKEAPSITRVVVSTDDEGIAAISREWGAEVVPRPSDLSGDKASSESALLHTLDYLRSHRSENSQLSTLNSQLSDDPDLVVFLQATSPCRAPGEIQQAIETLIKEEADSLLSVGPVHGFVWRVEKDGSTRSFSYDHLNRPRRQDAPEDLIENGSIYIFKPWVLRKFNNRLGGKIALHRMTALDSFQIDEPGDFDLLELIMRHRGVIAEGKIENRKQKSEVEMGQISPNLPPSPISQLLYSIRLLALDFDGVLTDNRVLVSEDGRESVLCSREDGLGLERLIGKGTEVVVISKEKNPVVAARCKKLGIECIQACENKLSELKQKAESRKLKAVEIAYVGNDVNDLECMNWVGLPIAVADAVPSVRAAAKFVTSKPGGHGAVREICDVLLAAPDPLSGCP